MNRTLVSLCLLCIAAGAGATRAEADSLANVVVIHQLANPKEVVQLEYLETADPEQAIRKYQDLIQAAGTEELRSQLLPPRDKNRVFWGLRGYAIERIKKMPNGHALYQELFDPAAQAELAEAIPIKDVDHLAQIAAVYPLSKPARQALEILGSIEFERARFDRALAYWERCLATFPEGRPLSALHLAEAAYIASSEFSPAALDRLIQCAKKNYTDDRVGIGGQKVKLVDYVLGLSKNKGARISPLVNRLEWPHPGGNDARSRIAGADVDLDARRWLLSDLHLRQIEPDPIYRNRKPYPSNTGAPAPPEFWGVKNSSFDKKHRPSSVFPIIKGGGVYINTGRAVVAMALEGEGQPLWQAPVLAETSPHRLTQHEDCIYACTIEDGLLYANLLLPGPDNKIMIRRGKRAKKTQIYSELFALPNRLACIRADTGQILWRTDKELAPFGYVSPPIKRGGRLYAMAVERVRPKTRMILIALDAENGKLLYKTFLAGLHETQAQLRSRQMAASPAAIPSNLAESAGRLYVCTNAGAITCIEAQTGDILWSKLYTQNRLDRYRQLNPTGAHRGPRWFNNAPILHEGVLYVTPTDSSYLYAINAANGRILNSVEVDGGTGIYTVGISQDKLFVAGHRLTALALGGKIPTEKAGAAKGNMPLQSLWSNPLNVSLAGIPALSSERLYLPGVHGMVVFDQRNGQELKRLRWADLVTPDDRRHARRLETTTGGNATLLGGALLLTNNFEISLLHNVKEHVASLTDERFQGNSNRARADARIAQTFLRAGQFQKAHQQLDKALAAIDQHRGPEPMHEDGSVLDKQRGQFVYQPVRIPLRDKLITDRMAAAYELGRQRVNERKLDEAQDYFETMTKALIQKHEMLRQIKFDSTGATSLPDAVTPTQIRYALLSKMGQGGKALVQKTRSDGLLLEEKYDEAQAEYKRLKTLWADHDAFVGLPPFRRAVPRESSLSEDLVEAGLVAAELLPHTWEGLKLIQAGKITEGTTRLQQGVVKTTYPVPSGKQMPTFRIIGLKETSFSTFVHEARAARVQAELDRFESLMGQNAPGARLHLDQALDIAATPQEKIKVLLESSGLYERLGHVTQAAELLKRMKDGHGKLEYPFKGGTVAVAEYVTKQLTRLEAKPKAP